MTTTTTKSQDKTEISVEDKLLALFELQTVDTEADKLKILRGELPLEVQDLEDEIAGLETRMANFKDSIESFETAISNKKNAIQESQALIKKYETQQGKVRNNREFESLSKELEFQKLEIQLSEKRIKEFAVQLNEKKSAFDKSNEIFKDRQTELNHKKSELDAITLETKKEEDTLKNKSKEIEQIIEPRLLTAYKRIRGGARNGLSVVPIERDACGGCYNKIPPQRQLDIRSHRKVIVCEHCGRILVDDEIKANILERLNIKQD